VNPRACKQGRAEDVHAAGLWTVPRLPVAMDSASRCPQPPWTTPAELPTGAWTTPAELPTPPTAMTTTIFLKEGGGTRGVTPLKDERQPDGEV
jgi:hypothetical protein